MSDWVNAIAKSLGYSKVPAPDYCFADENIQKLASGTYALFGFMTMSEAKEVARYAIYVANGQKPAPPAKPKKPPKKEADQRQMTIFEFMEAKE